MRVAVLLFVISIVACAGSSTSAPSSPSSSSSTPPRAEDAGAPAEASPSRLASCLAVAEDGAGPTGSVEGTVASGKDGLFTLRLLKPRCVVGLQGASFVAEVALVSTGFDLRPLVGARVRAHGEAIAGQTDMGGPAVVVMVKEVDRLPMDEPTP